MKNEPFLKLLGVLATLALLWLFTPFLKSFAVALLLFLAISPLQRFIQKRVATTSQLISTSIVTLLFAFVLFLPLAILLYQLLSHPTTIIDTLRWLAAQVDFKGATLPEYLEWLAQPLDKLLALAHLHQEEMIALATKWLGSGLKSFLGMMGEMVMILLFFFLLTLYGRSIGLFFLPLIPLRRTLKREFLCEMTTTMGVVLYTLLGVMMAQGVAFGVLIAFFEGHNAIMLGFLAGITSIIPIFGTALVWVPVALGVYFSGNTIGALIIALYSWSVMAFFIDNILKLLIISKVNRSMNGSRVRTHEFVLFIAIVGGLATFGFWGFLIGPAVVAFAITTFKTLRKANTHAY